MENNIKKVLYLMEYPIDLPGGGQLSTQTLCEGLSNTGKYKPVVCCPKLLKKKPSDYCFDIVTYKSDENREDTKFKRILNFLSRIISFKKIISAVKPDLIHVSMSESVITFGFLRCLGFFSKIPFVYTDRGLAYGYRKHSMFCIKQTLKHAGRLLTTTQFNKNLWLKESLKCDITVIPNTISTAFDDFNEEKRKTQKIKEGLSTDDFVIGFAGRISEEKDWDFVPVLVKALCDAGIKFKVALVLSLYEASDYDYAEKIKNNIITSIGEENLIYKQDLSQKEIADFYYMIDVFVMSSMFESFGKTAVEAMSRKCSVVSTSVGGLSEVIGKEENLYTKETVEKFVNRVKLLENNRDEVINDGEFFYKRYKENYTIEKNVERHVAVYDSLTK